MSSDHPRKIGDEARLWLVALFISLLLNGLLLAWMTYEVIRKEITKRIEPVPQQESTVVTLYPEMFEVEEEVAKAEAEKMKSVRTSEDQETQEAPKNTRYMGERNTQATSNRDATSDDATLPSQAGREPRPGELPETTESRYQDGKLDVAQETSKSTQTATQGLPQPQPIPPSETVKGETTPDPGEAEIAEKAQREKLLESLNSVEKEVAEAEVKENIKPRDEKKIKEGQADGMAEKKTQDQIKPAQQTPATAVNDPAFKGNQSKTAIRGNISRTGNSALDVVDTPMGRYHAKISRAVELEWQRNCVRRRDFIVPGYLTARFFIDAEGRVTNVNLLGEIEGGEIQKGFTIDSIRAAEIPPMPDDVKNEMGGDSLELIFNFYF